MLTVVIGDATAADASLESLEPDESRDLLATADASLAEVVAGQLPRIGERASSRIVFAPGPRDLLDGFDESYIHARIVEILDTLVRVAPGVPVVVYGFPPVATPRIDRVRLACDASARVTAGMRDMAWRPAGARTVGSG